MHCKTHRLSVDVIFCYCLQVLGKVSEKQGQAGVDEKYLIATCNILLLSTGAREGQREAGGGRC